MISGRAVQTGLGYKVFLPVSLQDAEKTLKIDSLQGLIERANIAIGELRALESMLPNPDLVIERYAMKEAVLSSQIEGTQSTLVELLENQNNVADTNDAREVQNYFKALNWGVQKIKNPNTLPLSSRLLRECHEILMNNVRGGEAEKTPGEFRKSQNWIGGTKPADAIFVPPPPQDVPELIGDLDKYMHGGKFPSLVMAALLHYQFETIHPFLDGNGRIGRLLITLFLIDKGVLISPTLYLSLYFKKHRSEYYDHLTAIRVSDRYEKWIEFFLSGVVQVSQQIMVTTKKILMLQEKDKGRVHSKNEIRLLELLLKRPVITIKEVERELETANKTAGNLVKKFEDNGILRQIGSNQRNRKYIYNEYIEILDADL